MITPVIAFGLFNAYLAVLPSEDEELRVPEPVERVSQLESVDLEAEALREAKRLESKPLVVQFGPEVSDAVRERIEAHLEQASSEPVEVVAAEADVSEFDADVMAIGFGDTTITRALIDSGELIEVGEEGYLLRSGEVGEHSAIAVDGSGTTRHQVSDVGVHYGAYALLEKLGFGFLHPLEPTPPLALPGVAPAVDLATAPRWPIRGLQLHTMHPIELTNLLQGWGPDGPDDVEGWEAMLGEWDLFLEWMLANGQNKVHWIWLSAGSWSDFAESDERIERIKRVVDRAHEFGIKVGLNVPIRLQQQNAARLIRRGGSLEREIEQIEAGVKHVMKAGFDYLATKPGTTEFTDVDGQRMLDWMDALTITAEDDHGASVYIKVHASQGQYVDAFEDPTTGGPINFNFLPHYADSRLGVLPHTVQHYSLSDPAPTYGNDDFKHIRTFLQEQAGSRPTVWFPETAYWVSFDNDVPLFLPVYASRRVHDLRLLAGDEEAGRMGRGEHAGSMMDGQITFSSGWEWGYWIQEVVTARAAWNPRADLASDEDAVRALLEPVERVFGASGGAIREWLVDYMDAQQDLLIDGRVNGEAPSSVVRRNGQAFLQGWETWDDVSDSLANRFGLEHGRMQPERISLVQMHRSASDRQEYRDYVAPLLFEMDERFGELAKRLTELRDNVPANALLLFEEMVDAADVTALRARQVRGLYAYIDAKKTGADEEEVAVHLQSARDALDKALGVTAHREKFYRVPADRIASWSANPTVYPFTYLWTVRSLFYWQRDEAQAVSGSRNPCLFNIIDPVDVVLDDGRISGLTTRMGGVMGWFPALEGVAKCMKAPAEEPEFLPVSWSG